MAKRYSSRVGRLTLLSNWCMCIAICFEMISSACVTKGSDGKSGCSLTDSKESEPGNRTGSLRPPTSLPDEVVPIRASFSSLDRFFIHGEMGGDGSTLNLVSGVVQSAMGASVCSGVKARD